MFQGFFIRAISLDISYIKKNAKTMRKIYNVLFVLGEIWTSIFNYILSGKYFYQIIFFKDPIEKSHHKTDTCTRSYICHLYQELVCK